MSAKIEVTSTSIPAQCLQADFVPFRSFILRSKNVREYILIPETLSQMSVAKLLGNNYKFLERQTESNLSPIES